MEASMASIEFPSNRRRSSWLSSRWTSSLALLINRLKLRQAAARERRQLRSLDNDILMDIGLSRTDVQREASRSFWDTDGMDLR
ncbi:MAG: DUF1127 domain-containing protein [Pseudomonadota bacterium]